MLKDLLGTVTKVKKKKKKRFSQPGSAASVATPLSVVATPLLSAVATPLLSAGAAPGACGAVRWTIAQSIGHTARSVATCGHTCEKSERVCVWRESV